jgi:hypothetical protein
VKEELPKAGPVAAAVEFGQQGWGKRSFLQGLLGLGSGRASWNRSKVSGGRKERLAHGGC